MKQERIDNYVMSKMSAEERNSFEQEIANDAELQAEVALHRDVVRAIRMKAAKEHLQKVERQIRAEERRRNVFKRLAPVIALAACLVVGVFVDYNYRESYKGYGFSDNIELLAARDGGTISQVIGEINDEEYKAALATIEEAMAQDISVSERDELEWYKAVTYMRMGKWIKARKLLKQIAASDSAYSEDAQKALEEL